MVAIRLPIWLVCALPLLVGCSVSANPYAVHPSRHHHRAPLAHREVGEAVDVHVR
jgi:hypothetical protein